MSDRLITRCLACAGAEIPADAITCPRCGGADIRSALVQQPSNDPAPALVRERQHPKR